MKLEIIPIEDGVRWDSIVRSFSNYDVFYLSNYNKAFEKHGDGKPILFYIEYKNTRGMNVVMKRDISTDPFFKDKIPINQYFDISSPYGYGGFLMEGDEGKELMKLNDEYCYENGLISEFVRFHLFNKAETYYSGLVTKRFDNVVRRLDMPIEEIRQDFQYKVRKNLNRANISGLTIKTEQSEQSLDSFLELYYNTMKKNNAKSYYYFKDNFFKELHKMRDHFVYFYVYDQSGTMIATELVIYSKEYCYSFLGGTNPDYYSLRPNDFLKFEIIKWAKEKNIKYFVLGGGYEPDDGIFNYKKSLAPNGIYPFFIGKKIFNHEKYNSLLKMKVDLGATDIKKDFFPEYRF